jgi:prepilin-type N-terminal cleavage/methylation domain-containing protein
MQRAFTLAEISTVIVVIGITGALAASSMADQVKDARAGAGAQSTVGDLREEYRQAREQLKGLRFSPDSGPAGVKVERVNSCASGVVDPAIDAVTVEHEDIVSKVSAAPASFCINPDGSVVVPEAFAQSAAASEPLVMIRSEMSGGRASLTVLRLDPVGFSELGSRQDTAAGIDALVGDLGQEGIAAFHEELAAGGNNRVFDHGDDATHDEGGGEVGLEPNELHCEVGTGCVPVQ